MVHIRIARNGRGEIIAVEASGHSGFAHAGSDIVCAAVSAVVQTAVHGVTSVAGQEADVAIDEGLLSARFRPVEGVRVGGWSAAQAILETMLAGLREIENGRRKHVRVVETREV